MAKKYKQNAIFSGKKYGRFNIYYKNKEDAIKKAKRLKSKGKNVIRDKNSKGHFLWVSGSAKSKTKKSSKKLTELETDWSNTDKLINLIKIGKKIDYTDFDKSGFSKKFIGTISKVSSDKGHIFVKRDNKETLVSFAFYEKNNGKVELIFMSSKISGYNKGFMRMIRKSDKGKGAFGK